jgi:hypothetical protein
VGGTFNNLGGQPRNDIGAVDLASGTVLPWDAMLRSYSSVKQVAVFGDTLYLQGSLGIAAGEPFADFASFNLTTGALNAWQPSVNGADAKLLPVEGTIYLYGGFEVVNGQRRPLLAAVDADTGALQDWEPGLDSYEYCYFDNESGGDICYGVGGVGYAYATSTTVVCRGTFVVNGEGYSGIIFVDRLTGDARPASGTPGGATFSHSADTNADGRLTLSELLRLIQLYKLGYHCDAASEDGFAPGPGDESCTASSSDYAPEDFQIRLTELLRAIQFHTSGGYFDCPGFGTEDGFCVEE